MVLALLQHPRHKTLTPDHLAARNRVVESHLALVDKIAKRLMKRLPASFEYDDLRSQGYLGLIDAAEKFRVVQDQAHDSPVPFRAYAALRIRGQIMESVRRRHWRNNTMDPINERVMEIPDARSEHVDMHIKHGELARIVSDARQALDDKHAKVIEIYFDREGQLKGIGAEFGVGESRSSQLLQDAKRLLAQQLNWRGVKAA